MVLGSSPVAVTSLSDFAPASSKEFLDIQATIECGFTLKRVRDMARTYSQYNSMRFLGFTEISKFPKILILKSFCNSWGNLYILCLLLMITLLFTCGERKHWSNIKRSQNIMTMIIESHFIIYFFSFSVLVILCKIPFLPLIDLIT